MTNKETKSKNITEDYTNSLLNIIQIKRPIDTKIKEDFAYFDVKKQCFFTGVLKNLKQSSDSQKIISGRVCQKI